VRIGFLFCVSINAEDDSKLFVRFQVRHGVTVEEPGPLTPTHNLKARDYSGIARDCAKKQPLAFHFTKKVSIFQSPT
jgi:hypothetical protein